MSTMRDLDKCQEIVTNARIALVDSQMFDYSQLVATACQGMLPEQGLECTKWSTFTEFLCFAQSAQQIAPDLHDAALHSLKSCSDIAESAEPEITYVCRMIEDFSLLGWLHKMQDLISSDPLQARSPWIWRSITSN